MKTGIFKTKGLFFGLLSGVTGFLIIPALMFGGPGGCGGGSSSSSGETDTGSAGSSGGSAGSSGTTASETAAQNETAQAIPPASALELSTSIPSN